MNSISLENLRKELEKLELVSGIIGTAIVNRNGLMIISNLPRYVDDRKLGAMAATTFGAMESAISTIADKLINITVEYTDYQLIMSSLDENTIVASLVDLNIDLGLIFIEIEECIKKVKNYIKGE